MSRDADIIRISELLALPRCSTAACTEGLLYPQSAGPRELECAVQSLHGLLDPAARDYTGDLDRGGGDHLDVDALLGEHLEDLGRDAGMRAHARADDRDLAHLGLGLHALEYLTRHRLKRARGRLNVFVGNGEGDLGPTPSRGGDVLVDHV